MGGSRHVALRPVGRPATHRCVGAAARRRPRASGPRLHWHSDAAQRGCSTCPRGLRPRRAGGALHGVPPAVVVGPRPGPGHRAARSSRGVDGRLVADHPPGSTAAAGVRAARLACRGCSSTIPRVGLGVAHRGRPPGPRAARRTVRLAPLVAAGLDREVASSGDAREMLNTRDRGPFTM